MRQTLEQHLEAHKDHEENTIPTINENDCRATVSDSQQMPTTAENARNASLRWASIKRCRGSFIVAQHVSSANTIVENADDTFTGNDAVENPEWKIELGEAKLEGKGRGNRSVQRSQWLILLSP